MLRKQCQNNAKSYYLTIKSHILWPALARVPKPDILCTAQAESQPALVWVPAVGLGASAKSSHSWSLDDALQHPWVRELGKLMLGYRIRQRAGLSAMAYSNAGATLKVCVKTFRVQQHCTPGRFVHGEGFYSISPSLVMTQLSRPRYIFLEQLGK